MTTHDLTQYASNIDRLNAFLDQYPDGCDPDFDDQTDELDRELAEFRSNHDSY